ncbi:MAG TPA: hypothetical protein VL588_12750 [Bdellovibrionota bacterium]|nr:hypothetical protein [Bdellovibrionota bacterium]
MRELKKKMEWCVPLFLAVAGLGSMGAAGSCGGLQEDRATEWLVLTCRFPEIAELPPEASQLEALFNGTDGLRQYYIDNSYGQYAPNFHRVETWVPLNYTVDEDKTLSRYERIERCIDAQEAADPNIHADDYRGVVVMRNSAVDGGNSGNVLVDLGGYNVTFLAHETGHTLGFGHSWDFSQNKNSDWSSPGEYFDYWDIMSAMAVYDYTNVNGFTSGPNMAVSYKMQMGWMQPGQMQNTTIDALTHGPIDVSMLRYDAAPAVYPQALIVRGFANNEFLSVEFRKQAGWDRAFPSEGMLVHRVKLNGTRPYVIDGGPMVAGQSYTSPEGVKVEVLDLSDDNGNVGRIRVSKVDAPNPPPSGSEGSPSLTDLPLGGVSLGGTVEPVRQVLPPAKWTGLVEGQPDR